jgi:N,N-dimethylformamidase
LLHVATADAFGSGGLATPEEFGVSHRGLGGDQNSQIRADMTFFPTARGGAVFTTGSIAWCMAFAHNGYDNNVALITGNVLRRFLDPAPLDGFDSSTSTTTQESR